MAIPAELHASTAVQIPAAKLRRAEVIDNATGPKDEVRCVMPGRDSRHTTNPSPFNPVSTPAGWFYPKKGDDALIARPIDGPDRIVEWWPAEDAEPDHVA